MPVSRLNGIAEPLLKIQQSLTTLKRINRPSDDPPVQGQVLRYDKRISETDQHLRNIDVAKFYTSSSESALRSIQEQLTLARQLALRAANAPSTQGLSAAAIEAKALFEQTLVLSNTYTGGRFIFAGHHEKTSPFSMQGSVMRSFIGSDLGYVGTRVDPSVSPTVIFNRDTAQVIDNNNKLTLTTRGGTFAQVTIPVGTYTTGAALAAAIQSAIDNAPEFRGAGRLITVQYEGDHLVVRSSLETATSLAPPSTAHSVSGANASVIAAGGSAADILGLSNGTNEPKVEFIGTGAVANNLLTISIDDKVSKTVTIAPGKIANGVTLANIVQSAINSDPDVAAANVRVTVTYDDDHRLVITSDSTDPSASSVFVRGGTASALLGLSDGSNRPVIEYLGDSGEIPVIIGPRTTGVPGTATTVISNLPGDRLFLGSAGGMDVLAAVGGLQAALEKGNPAGIQQALYDLDSAQKQISREQSVIGTRQNTIDLNQSILRDFKVAVAGFRSDIQDTDYAQALSDLTSYMNALQAAAKVQGQILGNMSLLEFLK